MIVVVDTNIIFSALLNPKGTISDLLFNSEASFTFVAPDFINVELDKYEEKIIKYSKLNVKELKELRALLMKKIQLINHNFIENSTWNKAFKLVADIDEKDTPFVALTLEIDGVLLDKR